MSPSRLTALIAGIVTGCLFAFVVLYDVSLPQVTIPPPVTQGLAVATGVFWISYVALSCRDATNAHADRNLDRLLAALADAIDETGDRRATAARLDALQHLNQQAGRRGTLTSVD
jgi:hypothetical protein